MFLKKKSATKSYLSYKKTFIQWLPNKYIVAPWRTAPLVAVLVALKSSQELRHIASNDNNMPVAAPEILSEWTEVKPSEFLAVADGVWAEADGT